MMPHETGVATIAPIAVSSCERKACLQQAGGTAAAIKQFSFASEKNMLIALTNLYLNNPSITYDY